MQNHGAASPDSRLEVLDLAREGPLLECITGGMGAGKSARLLDYIEDFLARSVPIAVFSSLGTQITSRAKAFSRSAKQISRVSQIFSASPDTVVIVDEATFLGKIPHNFKRWLDLRRAPVFFGGIRLDLNGRAFPIWEDLETLEGLSPIHFTQLPASCASCGASCGASVNIPLFFKLRMAPSELVGQGKYLSLCLVCRSTLPPIKVAPASDRKLDKACDEEWLRVDDFLPVDPLNLV
jgi:thymidine kinase